jgi:hypothetical protein
VDWVLIVDNGSHGLILTSNNQDTLKFEFGFYVSNLSEKNIEILNLSKVKMNRDSIGNYFDTTNIKVVFDDNFDIDKFRTQNVFYFTKEGREYKVIIPRKYGNGVIGVYSDSIAKSLVYDANIKFNLFGNNISQSNFEENFLQAIKNIEFKNLDELANKHLDMSPPLSGMYGGR